MRLNLIFHNIVESEKDINNKYTVTLDFYLQLLEQIGRLINERKTLFSGYQVYFDDGHVSFHELIYPRIKDFSKYTLAIITDDINKEGFLNEKMLVEYDKRGILISSHGVSHASLSFCENGLLKETPTGGRYQNTPKGQNRPLSENEIIYQFKESQKYLEDLLNHKINEFVFPYGLYNKKIVFLNKIGKYYEYLSTCDEYLDTDQSLKPRFLIDHKRTIEETIRLILNLKQGGL